VASPFAQLRSGKDPALSRDRGPVPVAVYMCIDGLANTHNVKNIPNYAKHGHDDGAWHAWSSTVSGPTLLELLKQMKRAVRARLPKDLKPIRRISHFLGTRTLEQIVLAISTSWLFSQGKVVRTCIITKVPSSHRERSRTKKMEH
jgi:hypothetical protein